MPDFSLYVLDVLTEYRLFPHVGETVVTELQRRSQLENHTVNDRLHIRNPLQASAEPAGVCATHLGGGAGGGNKGGGEGLGGGGLGGGFRV